MFCSKKQVRFNRSNLAPKNILNIFFSFYSLFLNTQKPIKHIFSINKLFTCFLLSRSVVENWSTKRIPLVGQCRSCVLSPESWVLNLECTVVILFVICCTLRSWVHQIIILFRTFSPRLEDNDTLNCSFDNLPYWPYISGFLQKCQNYVLMNHCSPIEGKRSWKSVQNLSLFLLILQVISPRLKNTDTLKCSSNNLA